MSEQQRASVYRASGSNRTQLRAARVLSVAAASAVVAIASPAMAIDWIGAPATQLPFEDGANWSGGSVPVDSSAVITNGGIAEITTFAGDVLELKLGVGISNP